MLQTYRASKVQISLTVYDTDGTTALNLTGMTLTLRIGYVGNSAVLSKAMTITDAANGKASVTLTATDTTNLNGTYDLAVWVTEGDGSTWQAVQESVQFKNVVLA